MLATKYLSKMVCDYIDPWSGTLASISWAIRDSDHRTIQYTPGQAVFVRYIISNLTSVVDWRVITTGKQWQVEIDNVWENTRRVIHDYAIGDLVYFKRTGIYRKLYYSKQGPFIMAEFFTNGTVWFQRVQVNERINIRLLTHHFIK